jgi:mannose-1-phosphate guanylyltransferase
VKAMILAGGLSTRLYPLTKQVPKPLVPVVGVPNAVHVIRYLKAHGYDEIAINVHYLAQAIYDALGDGSQFGVRLNYLHEDVLMGSAGAVKPLEAFFSPENHFVVVGCDDLTDLPLDRLVAMHRQKGAIATIGLVERPNVDQYGVVVLDGDARIVGFQEKPAPGTELSHLANTGIYCFSPQIFDRIPAGEFYDFGKQVFPRLQSDGAAFYGFDGGSAYWCDIGTPSEYRRASDDVVNGVVRIPNTRAKGVDSTAQVHSSAAIAGNVWVGAHARIAAAVRITGPSVIGDRCIVEEGAQLDRSILWEGVRVRAGRSVRESIVGRDFIVENDLSGAVVANEDVVSA